MEDRKDVAVVLTKHGRSLLGITPMRQTTCMSRGSCIAWLSDGSRRRGNRVRNIRGEGEEQGKRVGQNRQDNRQAQAKHALAHRDALSGLPWMAIPHRTANNAA